MNTKSVSIQKQRAGSSNVVHSNHQLQLSDDENKNKDQYREAKVKEDYFEPAQQRRLHGKEVVDNCSIKPNQEYIGLARFKERAHDFEDEAASNVCFKRRKGHRESCIPHLFGSKDRHCKVSTPKGLRDRRVRLSANTAIEFYDVQDRLGFDRPSNAIDWLMKEAEAAINALDKETPIAQLAYHVEKEIKEIVPIQSHHQMQLRSKFLNPEYSINQHDQQHYSDNLDNNFSFISLLCGSTSSTSVAFPDYEHGFDLRIRNQNQDLCLSLQSFQDDPTFLQQNLSPCSLVGHDNSVLSDSTPINFNTSPNPCWFQEMIGQNSNLKLRAPDSLEGHSEPLLEQKRMCFQRESLQSFLPSTNTSVSETDYDQMIGFNTSSVKSTGLVYNEFLNCQKTRGQMTTNPISISSSAASTFLNYQDYKNQE